MQQINIKVIFFSLNNYIFLFTIMFLFLYTNMARIISAQQEGDWNMPTWRPRAATVGRKPVRWRGSTRPPTLSRGAMCGGRWHHQEVHRTHLKHQGEVHWTQGLLHPPQACPQNDPLKSHLGGWADHIQSTLVHPQPCTTVQQEDEDLPPLSDGEDAHLPGRPQDQTNQKKLNCAATWRFFSPLLSQDQPPTVYDHH